MSVFYLRGVGVLGPGLPGWSETRRVLVGEAQYRYAAPRPPDPQLMPPNERRRGARTALWATAVAEEAFRASGLDPSQAASVFTSSSGDGETLHQICGVLAGPARDVSPTRFHNSVHNAPAGYWSIASKSMRASVALCGYDASFAAGLLEAAAQLDADDVPVLLVAYDLPYPGPLRAVRDIAEPLAVALLFARAPGVAPLGAWRVALASGAAATPLPRSLPAPLLTNPAAHALALLAAGARCEATSMTIAYLDSCHLNVELQP